MKFWSENTHVTFSGYFKNCNLYVYTYIRGTEVDWAFHIPVELLLQLYRLNKQKQRKQASIAIILILQYIPTEEFKMTLWIFVIFVAILEIVEVGRVVFIYVVFTGACVEITYVAFTTACVVCTYVEYFALIFVWPVVSCLHPWNQ